MIIATEIKFLRISGKTKLDKERNDIIRGNLEQGNRTEISKLVCTYYQNGRKQISIESYAVKDEKVD